MLQSIIKKFSSDLAIDLGTANTVVYARERGIVLSEPSVVAVSRHQRGPCRVRAVGTQAKEMLGRTPENIDAIRPIRDGVIADFGITEAMLRDFVGRARSGWQLLRPRFVVAVPSGITEVERRAVRESCVLAGASEVHLVEEAMAGAIGAGFDVSAPTGTMVVDIGGGTTEVALISCSGIVYSDSTRLGGDKMDEAIMHYVKRTYNVLIGERTAERIKLELGSAVSQGKVESMEIKGRDLVEAAPRRFEIKAGEVRDALEEPTTAIVNRVKLSLESLPPEISADIADKGLILIGGGSLLVDLDLKLRESTGLPVLRAKDPLNAVALGAGRCLDDPALLRAVTSRA